jgi:flagellar biosynthesis regulator FlaF
MTKIYPYAFYYTDNSYMIYDLLASDVKAITKHLESGNTGALELSIGFVIFKDIRAIIKQKEKEFEPEIEIKDADPELSFSVKSYLNELRGVETY